MDLFNQVAARLGEQVKSMTPAARLMGAASLLAVVGSVVWLFARGADGPDTLLMGGQTFSTTQLREMVGAFSQAGLEDYQVDGAKVRVPGAQQSKYMAALAEVGALPEEFGEYLREAVSASGFMLSGPRQEAQTKVAIQSELQLVISRMKGIENAFVHIAEETSQGFPQTKTVTASVGVQPRDEKAVDDATVAAIRSIVASAWAGLKPAAVTVVDLSGNRLFAGTTNGAASPPDSAGDYANQKRQLELDSQEKITRALGIPGALVTANVELDRRQHARHRVSVSVAIPQSYYEEIWRKNYATPGGSPTAVPDTAALAAIEQVEAAKIRAAILPLLGPAEPNGRRESQIAVSTIYSPPATPTAPPELADPLVGWVGQHWQSLGMGGLIVVGLLMLHSTIRSTSSRAEPGVAAGVEVPNSLCLMTDEVAEPVVAAATVTGRQRAAPTESLRAELSDMVRQQPQTAASVLRNWIGNAT